MTSTTKLEVEDSITCIICKKIFDDPRLMPCLHTYCRKCIERNAAAHKDQFECPLRDGYKILKRDIASLPVNQHIHDLVEVYNSIQRSNLCTNCRSNVAEYVCDTCKNESFCADCYKKEHTSRIMKKHLRLPISEKPLEIIPCPTHSRKQLECWCYTCEAVICIDCLVFNHKDHQYGSADDVAKEFEIDINNRLPHIQSSLKYRINQVETLINEVDKNSEINRKKITELMASLRQFIDEREKAMLEMVLTMEEGEKMRLDENYRTPLRNDLQRLNMQKAAGELFLSGKRYVQLLQIKQDYDPHVRKTDEKLKSMPMPTRIEYCLGGLDQLPILQEKIIQYGQYVEVLPYSNPQLEKTVANNQTKQKLDLSYKNLADSDMMVVANILRKTATLTTLDLENNQIGQQGVQYIAEVLRTNRTLTTLYLENNQIEQQGAQHLAEALKTNQVLTTLDLINNQIGQRGAQHLAEALKINQTLTTLYLKNNQIGPQGAQYVAEALKTNQSLSELYLKDNQIGQQGAQHLANALKINQTLTVLGLSDNQIGEQGAQHVADALKFNQTLIGLGLENNQIGQRGAQYVADALKVNQTLTGLGLENNQIGEHGAQYIAEALKINQTITTLYFGNNQIGDKGAQHIAEVLNTNQVLITLYLENNQIEQQGAEHIAEALKLNRTLTTLDLRNNQIGEEGVQYIADALRINQALTTLKLINNQIGEEGMQRVKETLEMNKKLTVY